MMKKTLAAGLPGLHLELPEERIDTLVAFGRAMVKQSEVMNLTGITDDKGVANLHLLDSLTVLSTADLAGKSLIDVGCGAGFPGVPLAIACPDAKITLLDSLGKRMKWLEEVLPTLGVSAECVTARAEEAVVTRRESYDFATSRAVARLNILLELTAPYVRVGGAVDGVFLHFFQLKTQLFDGIAALCQLFLGSHTLHGQHRAANLNIRGCQFQQDV